MKTCCKCKQSLPLNSFNKNRARRDGLAGMCRECWKFYYKNDYYLRGNEKTRLSEKSKREKAEKRQLISSSKDIECMDCGVKYPSYVMDFDHRNPAQKSFTIGAAVSKYSAEQIKLEIQKCDVVCANCHRIRTHG